MANVSKEDIYNALLILALQDIMSHDSTLSINRVILHIKNEYDMYLSKTQVNSCVDDAKQLIKKIKEYVEKAIKEKVDIIVFPGFTGCFFLATFLPG